MRGRYYDSPQVSSTAADKPGAKQGFIRFGGFVRRGVYVVRGLSSVDDLNNLCSLFSKRI